MLVVSVLTYWIDCLVMKIDGDFKLSSQSKTVNSVPQVYALKVCIVQSSELECSISGL